MDAVISSLDKNYSLCDTRITDSEIILYISSTQEQLCCPYCGTITRRGHSYHTREIQDLPIYDRKTILIVTTHKMKCMNPDCTHKTFAERHPFVNPNAQKTNRLIKRILKTSSEMSSVCSSMLLKKYHHREKFYLYIAKKTPLIVDKSKVYRVCIDDFALKKRYSFGTVMVDWDTHRIIDMIRQTVESMNGYVSCNYENGYFSIKIVLSK